MERRPGYQHFSVFCVRARALVSHVYALDFIFIRVPVSCTVHVALTCEVNINDKFKRTCVEEVMAYYKVLLQQLPGGSEEYHDTCSLINRYSNKGRLPEYYICQPLHSDFLMAQTVTIKLILLLNNRPQDSNFGLLEASLM